MQRQTYERKQRYRQKKSSSHFTSFEYALEKCQYENQVLNQKVTLLMQENRRLKMMSTRTQPSELNASKQRLLRSTHQQYWKLQNFNEMNDYKLQNNTCNSQYQNQRQQSPTPISFKGSHHESINQSQWRNQHSAKSSQMLQSEKLSSSNPYILKEFQIQQVDEDSETERLNCRQKLQARNSSRLSSKLKGRIKKYTKQVYLELQTARDEQQSYKVPTFFEASFGQAPKSTQTKGNKILEIAKMQLTDLEPQKKEKRISSPKKGYRIDSKYKYEQSYRISRDDQCYKYINDEKENLEFIYSKKTNHPYIKSDYKIMQPKTKLPCIQPKTKPTDILQQHMENQQENKPMIPNKSNPKRSFLTIMSKIDKTNILH